MYNDGTNRPIAYYSLRGFLCFVSCIPLKTKSDLWESIL